MLTGGGVSEIEALRVPNSSLNNKALENLGTIWHPQVPQAPKTGDRNPQACYNGQVLGQMQGGSSQFQYYPHLLALSKPQKIAGAQPTTKSQSGDFVLTGGGSKRNRSPARPQLHS